MQGAGKEQVNFSGRAEGYENGSLGNPLTTEPKTTTTTKKTGPSLVKEYDKAVYCHPAYLTYMQSTSYEMPGWMNHKLISRLQAEI